MSKRNNVVRLADVSKVQDAAVTAFERMEAAGENDKEFNDASAALELAKPATDRGMFLKLSHSRLMLENLRDGDTFTPDGWDALMYNFDGVLETLEARAARLT